MRHTTQLHCTQTTKNRSLDTSESFSNTKWLRTRENFLSRSNVRLKYCFKNGKRIIQKQIREGSTNIWTTAIRYKHTTSIIIIYSHALNNINTKHYIKHLTIGQLTDITQNWQPTNLTVNRHNNDSAVYKVTTQSVQKQKP